MKPNIYTSTDNSGFETPKYRVYYGPDEIDLLTEEFCGVVYQKKSNGLEKEVFRANNSKLLEYACGNSPEAMLIATLALYLSK